MNKKIKGATPNTYNGINFKSLLEKRMYIALLELGINPEYEKYTYTLSSAKKATVPFYNRTKKKGFHRIKGSISSITYTPDFEFDYNGYRVILEAKGKENDTFPLKRNLFRKVLEGWNTPRVYLEVRSKKELLEGLKAIKNEEFKRD